MCGIFVAFKTIGSGEVGWPDYGIALDKVRHRGPDNKGMLSDDFCFLGHTRLSIIDLGSSANQPFVFKSLIMTYNGEIFNYKELRGELQLQGYSFQTESDTEVILQAYDFWGTECFNKFNGMWSLAIYDKDRRSLIISRDRFGQKPLFTAQQDGITYFVSEPQQLVDIINCEPDLTTIKNFLEEGDSVKNGKTFFKNIQEYPSASYSVISYEGAIKTLEYWKYPTGKLKKSTQHDVANFEELLIDSVKLRLRSDVPVAVCLSGGVDSTIITDIVHQILHENNAITAFTYKAIDGFDESTYASEIARRMNCKIRIVEQPINADEYIYKLQKLVIRMGRGNSSPAIISNDCIHSEIFKEGFKVSLDGQGADELLAGYKTFYFSHIAESLKDFEFKQALNTFSAMLRQKTQFQYGVFTIGLMFLRLNAPSSMRKFMRRIYGYQRFFTNYNDQSYRESKYFLCPSVKASFGLNSHLIGQHIGGLRNLIYYGDMVAMNNSVENRSPFLDHRLVDFVFSRDSKLKVFNGIEKYALRAMSRYNKYSDILNRDKVGFESTIRYETKLKMQNILRISPILKWPIFEKELFRFINSSSFLSQKYERFVFRLFQVHLWSEQFNNYKLKETRK